MTKEGRESLAQITKQQQSGKRGAQAKATKGRVIYETQTGEKIEAENALILSEIVKIPVSTISYRLRNCEKKFNKGFAIYYKEH
jgi:hypothetical protein